MPKWADRAKAIINKGQTQFQKRSLDKTITEAKNVIQDIQFIVDSSELDCDKLALSEEGLRAIEGFYRDSVRSDKEISLGASNFERLMALALGQLLVEGELGEWHIYEGENHVSAPVVVRLKDGGHLDVFVFCSRLAEKHGVRGARSGETLSEFVRNTAKLSFD